MNPHDVYVASGLVAALAALWAICLAVTAWADRKVTRACHDALNEPLPPPWVNDGPRCLPPRPRRGTWREDCQR